MKNNSNNCSNQNEEKYTMKSFFKDLFNIRALPGNILSLSRIAAPFVIPPIAISGNLPLTLLVGAGFALTDFADGKIARALKGETKLGSTIDQVSDKICAIGLLVNLIPTFPAMAIPLVLEGVIAGINVNSKLRYKSQGVSTFSGKLKMWPLSIMTLAGYGALAGINLTPLLYLSLLATVGLEVVNIDDYKTLAEEAKIRKQYKIEAEEEKKKEKEKIELQQKKESAIKKIDKSRKNQATSSQNEKEPDFIEQIDTCDDIKVLEEIKKITCPPTPTTGLSYGQKQNKNNH